MFLKGLYHSLTTCNNHAIRTRGIVKNSLVEDVLLSLDSTSLICPPIRTSHYANPNAHITLRIQDISLLCALSKLLVQALFNGNDNSGDSGWAVLYET